MTVSVELLQRIETMPKVEIHIHLEGATDAETVFEMAGRNGIAVPARSLAEQGFSWEELCCLNLNTLRVSFLDEAEKAALQVEWGAFAPRLAKA